MCVKNLKLFKCLGVFTAIILAGAVPSLRSEDSASDVLSGISVADVALARKCIFSPESLLTLPAGKAALLDVNHDGVVSLEDLNGLGRSHSRWKTLFVAPKRLANVPADQPVGCYQNPFILTENTVASAGGFYDQIRKITFTSNQGLGWNAEIVFLPGTYTRIQLLFRNADTDEAPNSPSHGRPIQAVIDRLHPVKILLRSLDPLATDPGKIARFFGGSEGQTPADVLKYGPMLRSKSDGVNGNYPQFLLIEGDGRVANKRKISNLVVSGLNISGYRCGIDLLYATHIVLKNNRLDTIGSARTPEEQAIPEKNTTVPYGTSAIGMARLCENILIKHNRISTTWNRCNSPAPTSAGDPGLMHPFYIIDASDIVYLDNEIEDSSGALLKIVDLADLNPDGTIKGSPMAHRRQVLINNSFLESTSHLAGIYPVEFNTISMIHDNSAQVRFWPDKKIYTQPTPPAPNLIFLGNTWETRIDMAFLRRESVTTSTNGISRLPSRFPNWFFEGNTWIGFPHGPGIVERQRGTPMGVKQDITQEVTTSPNETIRFQSLPRPYAYEQCLPRLRQLVLGTPDRPATHSSGNARLDQALLDMVEMREIPRVSTDD